MLWERPLCRLFRRWGGEGGVLAWVKNLTLERRHASSIVMGREENEVGHVKSRSYLLVIYILSKQGSNCCWEMREKVIWRFEELGQGLRRWEWDGSQYSHFHFLNLKCFYVDLPAAKSRDRHNFVSYLWPWLASFSFWIFLMLTQFVFEVLYSVDDLLPRIIHI